MTKTNRTWTGTPQRPTDFVDFDECKCTNDCTCPKKVRIPIQTADGRTVVAVLTADEAERYAAQIASAAEFARALS
jgi:hypothetical protein